ncbi:MAG: hypothetical protein BIFFINMI_00440 [Phycisphaerae bacterium]|nr:hypothetical protein [Phycisphaerae bacterium]
MTRNRSSRPIVVAVLAAFALLLGVPFLLRPPQAKYENALTLVIISSHDEHVKREFERAFSKWHQEKFGRPVRIDWRNIGGGGEVTTYLADQYTGMRQQAWGRNRLPDKLNWPAIDGVAAPADGDDLAVLARAREKLRTVGIGIDVIFGGGDYRHNQYRDAGFLTPLTPPADYLANVPAELGGVRLYDEYYYWLGACLSRFGIIANNVVCRTLGVDPPATWADLARPEFVGNLALADPNFSGSAGVCYELVLQKHGWAEGWPMLARIAANARYFGSSSTMVGQDVSRGEAAAGMVIDYYGRTQVDYLGHGRLVYVNPANATATTADPISVCRGALHEELARRFVDFVVGVEGQKLWMGRVGTSGGPEKFALYRPPIRKDIYRDFAAEMIFTEDLYTDLTGFNMNGRDIGRRSALLGAMMRAAFIDNADLLKAATTAARRAGPDSAAAQELEALPFAEGDRKSPAEGTMWNRADLIRHADGLERQDQEGKLYALFHAKYLRVLELADGK